jgi:Cu-Zn family superoxide dismutase
MDKPMMRYRLMIPFVIAGLFSATGLFPASAQDDTAEATLAVHALTDDGLGQRIGTIRLRTTQYGLLIIPRLENLPPGLHGFHVHANADCGPALRDGESAAGMAAGGHYDPEETKRHEGPYGEGHLGDLPLLFAGRDGRVETPVLAPRLKLAQIRGRALIIHSGGDNYADEPELLGGGGDRLACAIASD